MPNPLQILVIVLGILLALSAAGNAWQYHQHGRDLVRIGTTEQLADDTKAAAAACSRGVEDLAQAGRDRHDEVLARLAAQAGQVADLQRRSVAALNAQPADPNDLCKSLERYLREQIRAGRAAQ